METYYFEIGCVLQSEVVYMLVSASKMPQSEELEEAVLMWYVGQHCEGGGEGGGGGVEIFLDPATKPVDHMG